jgi:FtsH-binding integral membrane protein
MSLLGDNDLSKFYDKQDRQNFVSKVYGILGFQLTLTSLITSIPVFNDNAKIWMHDHYGLMITAMIGSIVICCVMICCINLTRMVPINYLLMLGFTLCESYMVASVAARYSPEIVIQAATMVAVMTVGLTFFACCTSVDFVLVGPILVFILSMAVMMSMLFMFVFMLDKLRVFYCTLGVIFYSIYLVMDTQLIMGGKRYEVDIDDYILGAIILYTDIIMLFLYLLQLLGGRGRD